MASEEVFLGVPNDTLHSTSDRDQTQELPEACPGQDGNVQLNSSQIQTRSLWGKHALL